MSADLLSSRWQGRPGRLEVWYTTITDPATGTGLWFHHEVVAPSDGAPAYAHGWAAIFPPDAPPVHARFGPTPWTRPADPVAFAAGEVTLTADHLQGHAGEIGWNLAVTSTGEPLFTFPRWSWRRELLPATQIVPHPSATFSGLVELGKTRLELHEARGGTARIYGHGNALRWGWLHADLSLAGGEPGDVCELVAAVSRRPGMRRLPPLPFVRLRIGGVDWPGGDPLIASLRMTAQLGLPTWTVNGRCGNRRISINVTQPPQATLALDYVNPDGARMVCRNSERASATILLEQRTRGAWAPEQSWVLDGTAHAEVGASE